MIHKPDMLSMSDNTRVKECVFLFISAPQSSMYESIYEPINPRPPSQMSSRSNYSLYAPYVSGPQNKSSGNTQPPSGGKEAEVDALTDLLVQSMDGSADSDVYGMASPVYRR